jgi:hypothetical protein
MQRTKSAGISIPPKKKRIAVSSAKAKGRNLQKWVCDKISKLTGVDTGKDCPIESRPMGQSGCDVRMEQAILKLFPFSVECKAQESWSVSAWIEQAKKNLLRNTSWLLFFRKSRMIPHTVVLLDADIFFQMVSLIPEKDRDKIVGAVDNK